MRTAPPTSRHPVDSDEVSLIDPKTGAVISSTWGAVREHGEAHIASSGTRGVWMSLARLTAARGDWAALGRIVLDHTNPDSLKPVSLDEIGF